MYWKMWIFQTTQESVRGTSNLLIASMYWMVAFKIHVFDTSLFEETANRSNSQIWESFLLGIDLQYFEGCLRMSSFHLSNLENEVDNWL